MMNGSTDRVDRMMTRAWAFLAVAVFAWGVAHAEVGVYHFGPGSPPHGPYILAIIDDIDPVSWRPHSSVAGRILLNPGGEANGDGKPSMAYNTATDLPIVTWARNSASGFDVVVSHFENGAWTTPAELAASTEDELDPFVTIDAATGTVHVVYWINDGSQRVMHRQAPADLSSWSAPVQVSDVGQTGRRPAAVMHDGVLRVVFEASPPGSGHSPRQITLATQNGQSFTTELVFSSFYTNDNWPQVHSANGRMWVEWIEDEDQMVWTVRQLSGSWDPLSTVYFSTVEERDYFTRGTIKGLALD